MSNLQDIFGAGKAIEKLLDAVDGFIGDMKQPYLVKKMAQAKAEEIKIISDVINQQQGKSLDVRYENGKTSIKNTPQVDLLQRAQNRFAYQEMTKQENIEAVVSNARQELERDGRVNDKPVNKDWINRFFSYSGDFSSEEIRILWGKLLAGEIRRPNSISLRTLDVLKNLSIQEAIMFNDLAKYILEVEDGEYILPFPNDVTHEPTVKYNIILKLSECGLIKDNSNVAIEFKNVSEGYILRNNNFVLKGKAKELAQIPPVTMQCYLLTNAGAELCRTLHNETDNSTILQVYDMLINYKKFYTFSIHKIESVDLDGHIRYADNYTDISLIK